MPREPLPRYGRGMPSLRRQHEIAGRQHRLYTMSRMDDVARLRRMSARAVHGRVREQLLLRNVSNRYTQSNAWISQYFRLCGVRGSRVCPRRVSGRMYALSAGVQQLERVRVYAMHCGDFQSRRDSLYTMRDGIVFTSPTGGDVYPMPSWIARIDRWVNRMYPVPAGHVWCRVRDVSTRCIPAQPRRYLMHCPAEMVRGGGVHQSGGGA